MAKTDHGIEERRANAHPTKAFFVRMLTRDISLEDCILDLVDNAVDAAWASVDATPTTLDKGEALEQFAIAVDIGSESFSITDNCGGISLDDAADYAFTFGRDEFQGREDYTIGVYGIGMKRAVFKLGNEISIRSTTEADEPFAVPIDVKEWMADLEPIWDFDIESSEPLPEPGVEIRVSQLSEETATAFDDPAFVNRLRRIVARDYMLPLMQGLTLKINGKPVEGWEITFKTGSGFKPMRELYHEGEVAVEIFAGMNSDPPNTSEPRARESEHRSGWYVLCNGRVVLVADRTALSVWGRDRFPSWHPQYEGFVGVVLFSSKHPELLPMTTTKNSVDVSSAIYRRAVAKMQPPTRAWIDYTNARKSSRDAARKKEEATKPVPIQRVQKRRTVALPKDIKGVKDANIQYAVPRARVRALAKAFGKSTMAYREVGSRSFEFAYEKLVDEDDG